MSSQGSEPRSGGSDGPAAASHSAGSSRTRGKQGQQFILLRGEGENPSRKHCRPAEHEERLLRGERRVCISKRKERHGEVDTRKTKSIHRARVGAGL